MCPILVRGNIRIGGPATTSPVVLTIAPGCEVVFSKFGGGLVVDVNGSLQAVGTPDSTITFRPELEDSAWSGIQMSSFASPDSDVRFEHVVIDHPDIGLDVHRGQPTVIATTIQGATANGIELADSTALGSESHDLTVTGGGAYAIQMPFSEIPNLPIGTDLSGNALGAVRSTGGTVTTSATWHAVGGSYSLSSELDVHGATAPVLTLDPGVTVSSPRVIVGFTAPGGLRALGTPTAPVTFTGTQGWDGVWIEGLASDADLVLEDVIIDHGHQGLLVTDAIPTIHGLTIDAEQTGAAFRGNFVDLAPGATRFVIHGGVTSVVATAEVMQRLPETDSDYGGPTARLEIDNGSVTRTGSLKALGPTYVVMDTIEIGGTQAPILTIEPGVHLEFFQHIAVIVGYLGAGDLNATGTAQAPIVFTSTSPTKGYWGGLFFTSQVTASSVLDHTLVEWGGDSGFNGGPSNISIAAGGRPAIRNTTTWRSAGIGLRVSCNSGTAAPPIESMTYGTGVDANDGGDLSITGCQ